MAIYNCKPLYRLQVNVPYPCLHAVHYMRCRSRRSLLQNVWKHRNNSLFCCRQCRVTLSMSSVRRNSLSLNRGRHYRRSLFRRGTYHPCLLLCQCKHHHLHKPCPQTFHFRRMRHRRLHKSRSCCHRWAVR